MPAMRRRRRTSPTPSAVHSRRYFVNAQDDHPEQTAEALQQVEDTIKEKALNGEKKRQYLLEHAQPVVSGFFQWCQNQLARGGCYPVISSPRP